MIGIFNQSFLKGRKRMDEILITGAAGFIGWQTSKKFLSEGYRVVGIDDLNDYYDPKLKEWRRRDLEKNKNFTFIKGSITDSSFLKEIFSSHRFLGVVNLAARAGVRASIEEPFLYLKTNAEGTLFLLELAKEFDVKKFILASTSSIYANEPQPFSEEYPANTPLSPYAASKKAAEALSYSYHYLFGIDVFVLRFFTVYGPSGRPDMSVFKFIKLIDEGEELPLYGDGSQERDFTYIDDIAEGVYRAFKNVKGYEIINLGNDSPCKLSYVISLIENELGKKAKIKKLPFPKADMKKTWAKIEKAKEILLWEPHVSIEEGIKRTVLWYKENRSWIKDIKLKN